MLVAVGKSSEHKDHFTQLRIFVHVSGSLILPSLKLTAKAPENRGPLEKEIPIGNHHF